MVSNASPSKDFSKLAVAAEELIKAACSHVESTTFTLGKESIESLKSSIESNLNTLNQSTNNLKVEIAKLNDKLDIQTKHQTLAWAISNANINSFTYYSKSNIGTSDSETLVKTVLMAFRENKGFYINDRSMTQYHGYRLKINKEGEKEFRDALCEQIHALVGRKPRIALAKEGHAIYYS